MYSEKQQFSLAILYNYADSTLICIFLSAGDNGSIESPIKCIEQINACVCHNFLLLNQDKSEVIGAKDKRLKINTHIESLIMKTKTKSKTLV